MIESTNPPIRRNPYSTKLKRWEEEILEIEEIIQNIPEVNFFTLGVEVFNQLVSSQKSDFSEVSKQLGKIRSGVKKMMETLSCQDSSGSSPDANLDEYSDKMIDLLLKSNCLAKDLAKKDPQKHLKSIMNERGN
jgi:hypothetical protein